VFRPTCNERITNEATGDHGLPTAWTWRSRRHAASELIDKCATTGEWWRNLELLAPGAPTSVQHFVLHASSEGHDVGQVVLAHDFTMAWRLIGILPLAARDLVCIPISKGTSTARRWSGSPGVDAAGYLLAWLQHERDGSWQAIVIWVRQQAAGTSGTWWKPGPTACSPSSRRRRTGTYRVYSSASPTPSAPGTFLTVIRRDPAPGLRPVKCTRRVARPGGTAHRDPPAMGHVGGHRHRGGFKRHPPGGARPLRRQPREASHSGGPGGPDRRTSQVPCPAGNRTARCRFSASSAILMGRIHEPTGLPVRGKR
jgi:hypothetical protein